ncbi:MAG: SDR family oxidoreductase [Chloroflexi bacterium]|nr:SDR family oxidoreductase [Chloroflexota bacterium]
MGKVAIVTGASRGVGKGIATVYGREGAAVVVAARTERSDGNTPGTIYETEAKIEAEGGTALAVRCDVTNPQDVDAMVQTTLKTFGRIDVLINNAGGAPAMDEVRNCSVDDFDRTMALNVRGVFLGCKAVLPTMIAQRSGVIVNVTAKAGQQIMVPGDTLYGAAKAAIDRFSIGLGNEVEEYGISVVACSPGRVKTEMSRKRRSDMDLAAYREPEEVARVFVWLAQQTAQTFTMQVVNATEFGESWGPGK